MATLDKNNFISKEHGDILDSNFLGVKLFKNELKNQARNSDSRNSQNIKEFAISLHIYSPIRAYKFVHKMLHLPHPATLR